MAKLVLLFFVLSAAFSVAIGLSNEARWGPPEPRQWMGWKAAFGKRYSTIDEENVRKETWFQNKQKVDEHNWAYDQGKRSFRMEMNAFADQDLSEIRRPSMFKASRSTSKSEQPLITKQSTPYKDRPTSWDWRTKGAVNKVKDQGQIGSALAFDVVDAVASYAFIRDLKPLYDLSVQELLDCCLSQEVITLRIFDCVVNHKGLCLTGSYHHLETGACNNNSCKAIASPSAGGREVQSGNESALTDAVLYTPVVVGVDASHMSFQLYSSGVYSDPDCSATEIDHALLLVGYGVDSAGTEYWICKNTWGSSWGEDGYIRIARNHHNMCGIATSAIYPV